MRKLYFFIPAIFSTVFTVVIGLLIGGAVPLWYAWVLLMWGSGILLSKGAVWGSILGILPGIHIIYMSTQYTGQVINELPIGLVLVVYYLICGIVVWKQKKRAT